MLTEEIRLYTTSREREKYDTLADLYAIIRAVEALERAYVKDAVKAPEYFFSPLSLFSREAAQLLNG